MYLNCHTWYSIKYGTLSPEDLFNEAKLHNIHKIIITEINNTSSYVEMLRLCKERREEHALEIGVGIEFRIGDHHLYTCIAENNDGLLELNQFLSHHQVTKEELPKRPPAFQSAFSIFPLGSQPGKLCEKEFFGIQPQHLPKLPLHTDLQKSPHKYVILHPVTFTGKRGFNLHRILRAIDHNVVLTKLPPQAVTDERACILNPGDWQKLYDRFPHLIENTRQLLNVCSLEVEMGVDKNKRLIKGATPAEDLAYLRDEAWQGLQGRYTNINNNLLKRFERELDVIDKKQFTSYYLIAHDLIQFAERKGFDHVGRGSGANSLIAYCLNITNVDPLELNLYFERFLNEERGTPPDFDLDFSWRDRDAVYDYIFERYGRGHACLLGSFATFQYNAAVRELGKVFGLPKEEIDHLAEDPVHGQHRDHLAGLIFRYAGYMQGMPSHLSVHAGGILVSDQPLFQYTALDLPPKGYPVSMLDMYSAEDLGLYKIDVLSQRGLGHLKDTVNLIKKNRGIDVDIYDFEAFKIDERVRDLLRSSKAMGCFYIESPAMRTLIAKLKCDNYITLVAASSIIRPGVARSGMMKAYIERHHAVRNGKRYESIHPLMDELMAETYGVMVYQEDVIKVAHYFAGLSLTEADVLRRAMSGKYRARKAFDDIKEKFFNNCDKRGYPRPVSERVWYEIESFSGYSFAKGHSASYAVESYQSLFLKAYYPLEFITSVINNFGGFYKREFYFHEARRLGGEIEAPCVNHSKWVTTLLDKKLYIGFIHIKSLEQKVGQQIETERARHGSFRGLTDFLTRMPMGIEQISILIQIGALRFTGRTKQELKWDAMLYFSQAKQRIPVTTGSLFAEDPTPFDIPVLDVHPLQDAFDEMELLEFPLCDPFKLIATKDYGDANANELIKRVGKPASIVGYVVDIKNTTTRKQELMHFGTFLDCEGNFFDTVLFPPVARLYPFKGKGFYLMKGRVVEDFGVPLLEVDFMEKLPLIDRNKTILPDSAQPLHR